MEEIRAPDIKDQAKEDYLNGMKYKDLAEKYEVSLNTIKSWVKRYGWSQEKKEKSKKGAPQNTKRGAPLNNKNAVGNTGGAPVGNKNAEGHGAPPQNKNAETHGFFSKYLPIESLEIMKEIETRSPIDMLWDNIMIQYTAIIRAQRIMYVESKEEMIKELKKEKYEVVETGEGDMKQVPTEQEYEFQFAWDRQATFLNAQSRAISELRSSIKSYLELEGLNKEKSKAGITDWKAAVQAIAKRREKKKQQEVNSNG